MIRNTTLAVLFLGCLFASPALAQGDLLERARQQFQAIPTNPPDLPGNSTSAAKVELGLQVLTDVELSESSIGRDAFVAYQKSKETLATKHHPSSTQAGITNLLPH